MGNRYSKEELDQIKSLVAEGLTDREIASRLGRSEAGIRNIRYRLKLKRKTKDDIKSIRQLKKELQGQIEELNQTKTRLSNEVISLEEKKEHILTFNEELAKRKIENMLIQLKIEKPELFYISGEDQIAKLVTYFVKWLIS